MAILILIFCMSYLPNTCAQDAAFFKKKAAKIKEHKRKQRQIKLKQRELLTAQLLRPIRHSVELVKIQFGIIGQALKHMEFYQSYVKLEKLEKVIQELKSEHEETAAFLAEKSFWKYRNLVNENFPISFKYKLSEAKFFWEIDDSESPLAKVSAKLYSRSKKLKKWHKLIQKHYSYPDEASAKKFLNNAWSEQGLTGYALYVDPTIEITISLYSDHKIKARAAIRLPYEILYSNKGTVYGRYNYKGSVYSWAEGGWQSERAKDRFSRFNGALLTKYDGKFFKFNATDFISKTGGAYPYQSAYVYESAYRINLSGPMNAKLMKENSLSDKRLYELFFNSKTYPHPHLHPFGPRRLMGEKEE